MVNQSATAAATIATANARIVIIISTAARAGLGGAADGAGMIRGGKECSQSAICVSSQGTSNPRPEY